MEHIDIYTDLTILLGIADEQAIHDIVFIVIVFGQKVDIFL